jgi:hypothetical protein
VIATSAKLNPAFALTNTRRARVIDLALGALLLRIAI